MIAAQVLLEGVARPLLILHAIVGFAAVASATHLAVHACLSLRNRGASGLRRFAVIAPACAVPQFALGLLLYPAYRMRVRLPDFDRNAPLVAQLFDFKEHLAAIGVVLVIAAALLARGLSKEPQGAPDLRPALAAVSTAGAALMWMVAVLGLYVTARHPVGMP